jgi:hypothetical protein
MTSLHTSEHHDEIRLLDSAEVECVVGGYIISPIDISQMPDRSVVCGTKWILDRIIRTSGPRL